MSRYRYDKNFNTFDWKKGSSDNRKTLVKKIDHRGTRIRVATH